MFDMLCRGEMRVNNEILADAEGLFICAPEMEGGDEDIKDWPS